MPYVRRNNKRRSKRRIARRPIKRAIRREKRRIFRTRVKNIIQATAETKFYSVRGTKVPYSFQAGQTALNGNIFILTPPGTGDANTYQAPVFGQGTADGNRVANKIRIKKAMFNLAMWPEGYNATTNTQPRPMMIRMYFFRTKVNQMTVPAATALCGTGGNFFQNGMGTSGFVGNIVDLTSRINKDRYIYLGHKDAKLGYSTLLAGANGADALNMNYANNDFKYNYTCRMNITKMIPKQFEWDDAGNTTVPYTYALVQIVPADGSTYPLNCIPAKIAFEQYYEYTDM